MRKRKLEEICDKQQATIAAYEEFLDSLLFNELGYEHTRDTYWHWPSRYIIGKTLPPYIKDQILGIVRAHKAELEATKSELRLTLAALLDEKHRKEPHAEADHSGDGGAGSDRQSPSGVRGR